MARGKHSSLFDPYANNSRKEFHKIGPWLSLLVCHMVGKGNGIWCPCHQIFMPFVQNAHATLFFTWQAFLPLADSSRV
jgi:hypothetical protein